MRPSILSEEDHDSLIRQLRFEDKKEHENEREGNDVPVRKELPVRGFVSQRVISHGFNWLESWKSWHVS